MTKIKSVRRAKHRGFKGSTLVPPPAFKPVPRVGDILILETTEGEKLCKVEGLYSYLYTVTYKSAKGNAVMREGFRY